MVANMMRLNSLIVFSMLLIQPLAVADEPASEILDRVREEYDKIDDAEISFTQDVTFARTKLDQKSSGKLFLRKGNQYRLEFNDRTIVTDGKSVWSYSRATNQVIIDLFKMDERTLTPEKILTGAPADFSATVLEHETADGSKQVVLKMTPTNDNQSVTSLKLWVDESSWLIRKVEVMEFSGKKTTYTISELKSNIGLDAATFSFVPPQGAEIVDLR